MEPNPEPNRVVLLLRWNRASSKSLSKVSLDCRTLDGETPAVKSTLFKVQHGKHKGSGGHYYCHGSTASYNNSSVDPNLSSVKPFAMRPFKESMSDPALARLNLEKLEPEAQAKALVELNTKHARLVAAEISKAMETIAGGILGGAKGPAITKAGTSFCKAIQECATKVNPNLKSELGMLPGIDYPAAFSCKNAETLTEHTEPDCSFTAIYVFAQEGMECDESPRAAFNFCISSRSQPNIQIPLTLGMAVYYSGFLLLHRQQLLDVSRKPFYNVSAHVAIKNTFALPGKQLSVMKSSC